jgi:hypothetical protein
MSAPTGEFVTTPLAKEKYAFPVPNVTVACAPELKANNTPTIKQTAIRIFLIPPSP